MRTYEEIMDHKIVQMRLRGADVKGKETIKALCRRYEKNSLAHEEVVDILVTRRDSMLLYLENLLEIECIRIQKLLGIYIHDKREDN